MIANLKSRIENIFSFLCLVKSILILSLFFLSCATNNSNESDIESIKVDLTFERFDLKFYNQKPDVIPHLKKEYPFLFPKQFSDSVWINRQKDTLQILLQDAVIKVFDNIKPLEKKVSNLFKHIKHYFPSTKIPQVITLTNNVDYQIKTVYSDSLLLISLDTFLGSDNILYEGIPNYIRKELDQKYIPSQIVEKFSAYVIPPLDNRTFLAHMLYEGKKLFLQDLLLPQDEDNMKIAYSKNELDWVIKNEVYIWKFFIEKQLLYSTDIELVERFIEPAPFSKFYLQLDNESPGKIGRWIGWQIIRSFHEQNPDFPLQKLLNMSSQKIFNQSRYKPKQ